MADSHNHSHAATAHENRLWFALALTGIYLVAQVIGGLLTGSLALLSDAAHMMTDVVALAISIAAVRLARRPADSRRTFGYYRFEILAAAVNASLLFLVALYILYEAYQRFFAPTPINASGMLAVASGGLVVNLVAMWLLREGSAHSLNVKGAYLEVWADMLGSLGVIAAAILIKLTGWRQIDPIVAVAIGLWVVPRTWALLKASLNVLMEGVPEGLSLAGIGDALRNAPGVREVHELHVWSIASGKNSLTAHLVIDPAASSEQTVLADVTTLLRERFGIVHTAIQIETVPCLDHPDDCQIADTLEPHGNIRHDHGHSH